MPPAFLYFDMGNVLLRFDHRRATRQMAKVAGVDPLRVWETVFEGDLHRQYELGDVDEQGFYEAFCRQTGSHPPLDALLEAASHMFECNPGTLPLVAQLEAAGYRLGILSNTNPSDWRFCTGHFGTIPEAFEITVLSFQVHAMKPDRRIFQVAADRAKAPPQEIFFVDDRMENVEGARQVGFDAVHYTSAAALARELWNRGVRCNF